MAFQTGVVASFFDLLNELISFVSTNQNTEVVGTGDGATATFPINLTNFPISAGQLYLSVEISGVTHFFWEKEGVFVGDKIASSSINLNTGVGTVTFTENIANTKDITAIYSSATTAGRDWLVMLNQNAKDSTLADAYPSGSNKEIILKNSGVSGKDFFAIGYRESSNLAANYFGLNQNIYRSVTPSNLAAGDWNNNKSLTGCTSYDNTRETWSNMPTLLMAQTNLVYWFFSNKRRIIIVVRSLGNIYLGGYLGGIIRFANPSNYAFPIVNIGSIATATLNVNSTSNTFFSRLVSGGIGDKRIILDNSNSFIDFEKARIIPSSQFSDTGQLKQTTNGKVIKLPCYMFDNDGKNVLGQLDGVYLSPFVNLQSEDTMDGGQYIVFQNHSKADYNEFTAIEDS